VVVGSVIESKERRHEIRTRQFCSRSSIDLDFFALRVRRAAHTGTGGRESRAGAKFGTEGDW
jgi:hypothetical protein